MFVSVIISTYESPEWLAKVVWGYAAQTHRQFEIVIADDGSSSSTAKCIEELRSGTGLSLRHVWHAKQGFRKCRILNQAILASAADYLIFSDGDCIPRHDFIEQHVRLAAPGWLLSGGRLKLPRKLSEQISARDIFDRRIASPRWLQTEGCPKSRQLFRLKARGPMAAVLDVMTTTRATFNGHNTSVWKSDVLRVNGFDERLGYGGLDRELGERLFNAGVRPRQIRHRAVCMHLDHDQDYVDPVMIAHNLEIRAENQRNKTTWTAYGIDRHQKSIDGGFGHAPVHTAPMLEEIQPMNNAA
jgi:glycosyltransferase involved in cell wall biosynthesis